MTKGEGRRKGAIDQPAVAEVDGADNAASLTAGNVLLGVELEEVLAGLCQGEHLPFHQHARAVAGDGDDGGELTAAGGDNVGSRGGGDGLPGAKQQGDKSIGYAFLLRCRGFPLADRRLDQAKASEPGQMADHNDAGAAFIVLAQMP
jgi:hypothetical protein